MSSTNIKIIDFTGRIFSPSVDTYDCFSETVTNTIRQHVSNKLLIVVDQGFGFKLPAPHVVSDHLNLTGTNPLMGANDPCGERFPIINDIYKDDLQGENLSKLSKGVLGGLKDGTVPSAAEEAKMRSLGADFFSYNLVQTMIVAAHSGLKVIGVVVPKGAALGGVLVAELEALVY